MSNWSGVSQAYRDSFALLCAGTQGRILHDLDGGPLLDVGSGTGSLTRAALQQGFDVTAVDPDPDMVAMTNRAAPGTCTTQALPTLSFADDGFRSVVANFVVNHLPDPRAGVRELARVTAPGGRLAMTIWPAGGAGWAPLVNDAFDVGGATPLPGTRLPAHLNFPRTTDGLADLATGSGLAVVSAETLTWQWHIAPEKLWAGISGGVATPGARYLAQTTGTRRRVEQAFLALARDQATGGQLHFTCSAAYVLAAG